MTKTSREFFTQQFTRLDQKRPSAKKIADSGLKTLDIIDIAKFKGDKAASNPHLNNEGKRQARQSALFDDFVDLERIRKTIADVGANVDAEMRALALPSLNKGDIVAALMDQEARALVRAMPEEKRNALERLTPALAAAVVRGAPELSGVSPSTHAMLRDQLIETAHPQKVAAYRADKEAIEVANLVVKQAAETLHAAADFAPGEDREYLKKVQASTTPEEPRVEVDPNDMDALIRANRRKAGIEA